MDSPNFPYKIFFNSVICASTESFSSSSFSKFLPVTSFICSILVSTSSFGTWAKTSPIWNRTTSSSVRINSLLASSRLSLVSWRKGAIVLVKKLRMEETRIQKQNYTSTNAFVEQVRCGATLVHKVGYTTRHIISSLQSLPSQITWVSIPGISRLWQVNLPTRLTGTHKANMDSFSPIC